jgi:hypothetical protein
VKLSGGFRTGGLLSSAQLHTVSQLASLVDQFLCNVLNSATTAQFSVSSNHWTLCNSEANERGRCPTRDVYLFHLRVILHPVLLLNGIKTVLFCDLDNLDTNKATPSPLFPVCSVSLIFFHPETIVLPVCVANITTHNGTVFM